MEDSSSPEGRDTAFPVREHPCREFYNHRSDGGNGHEDHAGGEGSCHGGVEQHRHRGVETQISEEIQQCQPSDLLSRFRIHLSFPLGTEYENAPAEWTRASQKRSRVRSPEPQPQTRL